jgi:hypothetical protein
MDWSKDINFMLALAAEHQKVPIIPSFANKFPQGLSDSGKLQSQ